MNDKTSSKADNPAAVDSAKILELAERIRNLDQEMQTLDSLCRSYETPVDLNAYVATGAGLDVQQRLKKRFDVVLMGISRTIADQVLAQIRAELAAAVMEMRVL